MHALCVRLKAMISNLCQRLPSSLQKKKKLVSYSPPFFLFNSNGWTLIKECCSSWKVRVICFFYSSFFSLNPFFSLCVWDCHNLALTFAHWQADDLAFPSYQSSDHLLTFYFIAFLFVGAASQSLYFAVKFYAVDPCKLVEELTRWASHPLFLCMVQC